MAMTFTARASGAITLLDKNAREILGLLGKDPGAVQGILTAEQLPGAIALLQAASSADRAQPAPSQDAAAEAEADREVTVRLAQRIAPLLDLLERARTHDEPVTWGT